MTFMIAMVAFAVDIGNLCRVNTETQAVADAAALAGARVMSNGTSAVQSAVIACAAQNKANGQSITLTNSNITLGTWNATTGTFTAVSGSTTPNAVQVNVPLTSANSNPVTLYFAQILGETTANVTSSAIAGGGGTRWDMVLCCDRSSSFSDDLGEAVTGMQDILSSYNTTAPTSYLGVVTFNGVGYTIASLQEVSTNYATLNTAISGIVDCANGGQPCSGSDLAAGMQTAISLFSASGYNPPAGTKKAIIFISDGAANVTSQCLNKNLSDTGDNTLAATEAANAYTNSGISVFSLLYYHGSDNSVDTNAMQALIQGQGIFLQETDPSQLPADLQTMFSTGMKPQLLK